MSGLPTPYKHGKISGTAQVLPTPTPPLTNRLSLPGDSAMSHDTEEIPYGYCHCGCGEKTNIIRWSSRTWGHVKGEPYRYIAGHHMRKSPHLYIEDQQTGCWVWQRGLNRDGYGKAHIEKTTIRIGAHRMMYEKINGPIPDGLQLDHICRNRACVNPDHLEPVTHLENTRRRPSTKLSTSDIPEIFRLRGEGWTQKEIANLFHVSQCHISRVLLGQSWSESTHMVSGRGSGHG